MRKLIVLVAALYFVALAIVGVLVWRATPAPFEQTVRGLALGSHFHENGVVYLSGRRLDCSPLAADVEGYTTRCTVPIAGKVLELYARRNPPTDPNQLGGRCQAIYDGKAWPCAMGSRHVHVHRFVYLGDPLGLSTSQMDALRRHHLFENLPEATLLRGVAGVTVATALVGATVAGAWFWPHRRRRAVVALAAPAMGSIAGVATFVLSFFLTAGLWD